MDTQHTRRKLIVDLEQIFEIASNYARGEVKRVSDEKGKEQELTIAQRQYWARIAAFTAQTINSIAKGIDERQIDRDMDELERMLNKTKTADTAQAVSGESPGKSEGA